MRADTYEILNRAEASVLAYRATVNLKIPAPFTAQVHFKPGCEWQGKHKTYVFRSDHLVRTATNNLKNHYEDTIRFLEKEIRTQLLHAVIWNNTQIGKKMLGQINAQSLDIPWDMSMEWMQPSFDKIFLEMMEYQFKLDKQEIDFTPDLHKEIYANYKKFISCQGK